MKIIASAVEGLVWAMLAFDVMALLFIAVEDFVPEHWDRWMAPAFWQICLKAGICGFFWKLSR